MLIKHLRSPSSFPPLEPPSYRLQDNSYRLQVTGDYSLQVMGYRFVAATVATGYGFNSNGSRTPERGRRIRESDTTHTEEPPMDGAGRRRRQTGLLQSALSGHPLDLFDARLARAPKCTIRTIKVFERSKALLLLKKNMIKVFKRSKVLLLLKKHYFSFKKLYT